MTTFRQLDWTACTMRDVCAHSALTHPSLYREALYEAARVHEEYARRPDTRLPVARIAMDMSRDLRAVADRIDDGDMQSMTLAEAINGFTIAARLQLIPPHIRADISARD